MSDAGVTDRAADEVVELCRDLIRIDSSTRRATSAPIAEYVAGALTDAGLDPGDLSSPSRAAPASSLAGQARTAAATRC